MAAEIAPEEIIKALYRAALRRAPDDTGLATYLRLLNDGASPVELLNTLMDSDEFRQHSLVSTGENINFAKIDDYQPESDRDISRFLTQGVREVSNQLKKNMIKVDDFRNIAKASLDHIVSYNPEFGDSQKGYFEYHERRFYEIAGVVKTLIEKHKEGRQAAVLDFGFSVNSYILRRLFPDVTLAIADRPQMSPPAGEFDGVFAVDLSVDNIDQIILEKQFDLIIFSEVIEHVMINPVKILKFLLHQLTDTGHTIVTTPNLFSRHKLHLIAERKNPLPAYPIEYGKAEAPHFHVREYCMSEILSMIETAGGRIESFFFSNCWDSPDNSDMMPENELGNMVFVFGK